jgi:thiol-disulfide isomerase/thioredoxin
MPPDRREFLTVGAVGLAAVAAGSVVGPLALQWQSGASELLSATFPDLSGRPRRLSEWQGYVALVNFWATWCTPCRDEIPFLIETRRRYGNLGLEVIGIGIDRVANMQRFADNFRITYPLLAGDWGTLRLLERLGNGPAALPYTVVLDRHGAVAYRKLGVLQQAEVAAILTPLLR